jgi:hypothetical protein
LCGELEVLVGVITSNFLEVIRSAGRHGPFRTLIGPTQPSIPPPAIRKVVETASEVVQISSIVRDEPSRYKFDDETEASINNSNNNDGVVYVAERWRDARAEMNIAD